MLFQLANFGDLCIIQNHLNHLRERSSFDHRLCFSLYGVMTYHVISYHTILYYIYIVQEYDVVLCCMLLLSTLFYYVIQHDLII